MLTAKDFLDVAADDVDRERVRLISLHEQISLQTPADKQRLVTEFLAIITDFGAKIHRRIMSVLILGNHCQDLGIKGSLDVIMQVRQILEQEFIRGQQRLDAVKLGRVKSCFIEGALCAMIRIDIRHSREFVLGFLDLISADQVFRARIARVIRDEEERE